MATLASAQARALRNLLHAAVTGNSASIAELVTDDVVGWSPNLAVRSRADLLAAMDHHDDGLSEVELQVRALDQVGDRAFAEWHVAADHTGPMVVDDGVVIEPTGRRLHLSGATVAEFDGDRVCAFRSYFDDLALVEQALTVG